MSVPTSCPSPVWKGRLSQIEMRRPYGRSRPDIALLDMAQQRYTEQADTAKTTGRISALFGLRPELTAMAMRNQGWMARALGIAIRNARRDVTLMNECTTETPTSPHAGCSALHQLLDPEIGTTYFVVILVANRLWQNLSRINT